MTEKTGSAVGRAVTRAPCLGRSEVLRSLRHYLQTQSQERHTILPPGRERRRKRNRSTISIDEKGPLSIKPILELLYFQLWENFIFNFGKTSDKLYGAHMGFSELVDTIMNWTELRLCLTENNTTQTNKRKQTRKLRGKAQRELS